MYHESSTFVLIYFGFVTLKAVVECKKTSMSYGHIARIKLKLLVISVWLEWIYCSTVRFSMAEKNIHRFCFHHNFFQRVVSNFGKNITVPTGLNLHMTCLVWLYTCIQYILQWLLEECTNKLTSKIQFYNAVSKILIFLSLSNYHFFLVNSFF